MVSSRGASVSIVIEAYSYKVYPSPLYIPWPLTLPYFGEYMFGSLIGWLFLSSFFVKLDPCSSAYIKLKIKVLVVDLI